MEPIDHLKNEAEQVRLSAEASARMRERIAAHARAHPVLVRSPYQRFMHSARMPLTALSLMLLVGVGGATSYAALGSLPGDPLYAVKVGVIEPMQAVLTFSPQGKALLQVKVAETRASEEVQLAAKNKLTPEQGVALKEDFDHSLGAARDTLKTLSKDNPSAAKELEAVLRNSLDEHESALNRFAISSSTATSTAVEARAFADHIRNKARLFKDNEEEATSTLENSSQDGSKSEDDATSSSDRE